MFLPWLGMKASVTVFTAVATGVAGLMLFIARHGRPHSPPDRRRFRTAALAGVVGVWTAQRPAVLLDKIYRNKVRCRPTRRSDRRSGDMAVQRGILVHGSSRRR